MLRAPKSNRGSGERMGCCWFTVLQRQEMLRLCDDRFLVCSGPRLRRHLFSCSAQMENAGSWLHWVVANDLTLESFEAVRAMFPHCSICSLLSMCQWDVRLEAALQGPAMNKKCWYDYVESFTYVACSLSPEYGTSIRECMWVQIIRMCDL
jgi:hypothetical protein